MIWCTSMLIYTILGEIHHSGPATNGKLCLERDFLCRGLSLADITTEKADVFPVKQELNLALKYPNSALLVSHPGFPDSVHQVQEDNATSWEVVVANVVSGRMIRLSLTTWNSPTVDGFVDVCQSLSTCCYQFSALHLSGTTLRDLSWDVG
ncbi:unnamed protein product [Clavelina lepadiformis]|uniref:Uncharacterized protein n=1 Tax=Clavelina lepadiformis TaxID=159417 RepID=A0ABP0FGN7_CLALP